MGAALGIMIEGQEGLNWAAWKHLCERVEGLGLDSLWRSDHLVSWAHPELDCLDTWTSLALCAEWTSRIEFGPLVCPITFRPAGILAKAAAAVDLLAGGRFVLGVGAGWNEPEHSTFDIPFPGVGERMDLLEKGLATIIRVFRESHPRPPREGIPLLVGGSGEKRTLALTARHANEWNTYGLGPEDYAAKAAVLDAHCREVGRDPGEIRRSLMIACLVGRDHGEVLDRADRLRTTFPRFEGMTPAAIVESLRGRWFVGTPDELAAQLDPYVRYGVSRFMVQHFLLDDDDGLELLARQLAPRLDGGRHGL